MVNSQRLILPQTVRPARSVPRNDRATRLLQRPGSAAVLLVAVALTCGCGQRGPLYLPNEQEKTAEERSKRPVNPGTDLQPAKDIQTR